MRYWEPVKFAITEDGNIAQDTRNLHIEWRGAGAWAVTEGGCCLNNKGKWEYEPHPSSRSNAFIKRTRFTFEEAVRRANETLVAEKVEEVQND